MTNIEITDIVEYQGKQYRVDMYYQRVEETFFADQIPEDIIDQIGHNVISGILLREKLEREEKGLPHTRRFRYRRCNQADATHFHLYGSLYPTAPIGECTFVEKMDGHWSPEFIQQTKDAAVGDFWLVHNKFTEWEWE